MTTVLHSATEALGSCAAGRLVFASGAAGLTLRADPSLMEPFRARFERHTPRVSVADGTVTIRYRDIPVLDWILYAVQEPRAFITVNAAVPWDITFHDGVKALDADVRSLQLRSFEVRHGVDRARLALPRPHGTVSVRIAGGASELAIHRPSGVAARLEVGGGVSQLVVDHDRFGAIGNGVRWQSPDYDTAEERYDITIGGGASQLTIGQIEPGR
jgi:hypothetical protein